ncbi:serine protease FAM111A-like isoform X2 [Pempheris klunzingeri]
MERPQPGGAAAPQTVTREQVRVKEEDDGGSTVSPQRYTGEQQLHRFIVKYSQTDASEYPFYCDRPRTVLEALRSTKTYHEKMKYDENVVIQLGKEDGKTIVATHFPCSCIVEGEVLIISSNPTKIEEAKDQQNEIIHSKEKYSVFFIDTVGGKDTKQKKLFRNNAVKSFKYLCVYGEKGRGMTVEEALKRDGRFIDDLTNFTLTDNDNPNSIMICSEIVDNLDQKSFKIRLPRNRKKNDKEQQEEPPRQYDTRSAVGVVHQKGVSVRAEAEKNGGTVNTQEIYERLRQQFPDLKKLMESRFPGDSYQKALSLRKENFGKIQHSFSEIHRVKKLLGLGESVCKVVIQDVICGSGFVLFDNFILTNAHLFKDCVEGEKLKEGIKVFAIFNYEDPEPQTKSYYFQLAHHRDTCGQDFLDYAIFELNPQGYRGSIEAEDVEVPPGLLKNFGPIPQNGEGCIIGHPGGNLKKMDPICIIEKEKREQAVTSNLGDFKDHLFTLCAINHSIKNDPCADVIMTYNTFMYHGSSGSPVFDARGQVFGLHTGGFFFGSPKPGESVIEFANPLIRIFEHFVTKLKERGKEGLLSKIKKEINGNSDLKKVFKNVTDTVELMNTD